MHETRRAAARVKGDWILAQMPLVALVVLCLIAALLSPRFLSATNINNILVQGAVMTVIAIGMTYVIIVGGFDLSVGSVAALSGCLGAMAMLEAGIVAGVAAGIAVGALVGLLNGLIVTKLDVNAFIATLATLVLFRGVTFLVTGAQPVVDLPPLFADFAVARVLGIPLLVWLPLVIFLVFSWLLHRTAFGLRLFAIGGNREAAFLAGIAVERVRIAAYALCGTLAGVAGMMLASRLESGQPTAGILYELTAIAAVVLGGASLYGGEGKLYKTVIGVFITVVLANALNLADVHSYWQQVALGIVLVAAAAADRLRRKSGGARAPTILPAAAICFDHGTGRRMMNRTLAAVVFAAAAAFSADGAQAQAKIIGVSLASDDNPFYVAMLKGIREKAKALGYEVSAVSANEDVARQLNGINDLVARKVAGILISPIDAKALCSGYDKAKAAGIPIMSIARGSACESQTLHVSVNEVQIGREIAGWIAKKIGGGKVAMLAGPAGAQAFQNFARGFEEEIGKHKDIKVAFRHEMLLTRENGLKYAEDALVAHSDLKAIYGANDELGMGAAQAVRQAGRKQNVVVTGMNGIPPALRAVQRGEMDLTVVLNPVQWGELGVDAIHAHLAGKKAEGRIVYIPHVLVDQSNVGQFLPKP